MSCIRSLECEAAHSRWLQIALVVDRLIVSVAHDVTGRRSRRPVGLDQPSQHDGAGAADGGAASTATDEARGHLRPLADPPAGPGGYAAEIVLEVLEQQLSVPWERSLGRSCTCGAVTRSKWVEWPSACNA
jgi:hypothetical protein